MQFDAVRFVFYLFLISPLLLTASTCPREFNSWRCRRQISRASHLLHEACALTPFASGCSVHRICHEVNSTTDSCQPLHSLVSVCGEYPDLVPCSTLSSACSSIENLLSCDDIIDLDLPSTEESYEAIQQICESHYMTGCDLCQNHGAFNEVIGNYSMFSDDCIDPFGTLSQMCLVMDMTPCDIWENWCSKENSNEIPRLCEAANDRITPSNGHGTNHPMESPMNHDHSSHDMNNPMESPMNHDHSSHGEDDSMERTVPTEAALQAADGSSCVQDPTMESCKGYRYPENSITDDIVALCGTGRGAMPWMSGCSLWRDSTLCEDMPLMTGCRTYESLCTEGSVIEQCTQQGPIPWAPKTMKTQRDIIDACSSHYMPQCGQCPSQGAACAQTLSTMAELCYTMPSMSFCRDYRRFCSATNDAFGSFCDLDSNDYLPPMRMYFHTGQRDIILFREWIPESTTGYVLSFFAVVIMGILVQALKALRTKLEGYWHRRIIAEKKGDCPICVQNRPGQDCDPACQEQCGDKCGQDSTLSNPTTNPQSIVKRNTIRAILTSVTAIFDFALMLVAMTFNVGLFIAVITGLAIGVFVFGHIPEMDYTKLKNPLADRVAGQPFGENNNGCCA
eukprot:g3428.t1